MAGLVLVACLLLIDVLFRRKGESNMLSENGAYILYYICHMADGIVLSSLDGSDKNKSGTSQFVQ